MNVDVCYSTILIEINAPFCMVWKSGKVHCLNEQSFYPRKPNYKKILDNMKCGLVECEDYINSECLYCNEGNV